MKGERGREKESGGRETEKERETETEREREGGRSSLRTRHKEELK